MILIKITDKNGQLHYVNPDHVVEIIPLSNGFSISLETNIFNVTKEQGKALLEHATNITNIDNSREKTQKSKLVIPKSLAEAVDVEEIYGRLTLTIKNGIDKKAVRQWLMTDSYEKFEFDGYCLYMYKKRNDERPSFNFECGKGGTTLVSSNISAYGRAVKAEMVRQAKEKGLDVTKYGLS